MYYFECRGAGRYRVRPRSPRIFGEERGEGVMCGFVLDITGDHSKQDLRYTQKPVNFSFFTSNT